MFMEVVMNYCYSCMNRIDSSGETCPICGKRLSITVPIEHLVPGTVLNNRYVVGYALGQGGFGITYIGFDNTLERRVAIKEYFPTGYVTRINSDNTVSYGMQSSDTASVFMKGKENFLKEARNLAKFSGHPGIVDVRDFFESHNTAYIIMEYLEGTTLKQYLQEKGHLFVDETLELLKPVMEGLCLVHKGGLIHRDISPDNIMLTRNHQVKLLDFGAARDMAMAGGKSLSIMLKPGFAPEEQYRSRGEQGPWTDVYALSATIYKCITGRVPDEVTQRIFKDEVAKPSEIGVAINAGCEDTLMRGLAINISNRVQNVEELMAGLYGSGAPANNNYQGSLDDNRTVLLSETKKSSTGNNGRQPDLRATNAEVLHNKEGNAANHNSKSDTFDDTNTGNGKSSKGLIIAIVFLGLCVLGVGAYFIFNKPGNEPKSESESSNASNVIVENADQSDGKIDTDNADSNVTLDDGNEAGQSTPAMSENTSDKLQIRLLSEDYSFIKNGDVVQFGHNAENPSANMTWKVLSLNDGLAMVTTEMPVSATSISSGKNRTSDLARWLNESFYVNSFADTEKSRIRTLNMLSNVPINDALKSAMNPMDKVFLLTIPNSDDELYPVLYINLKPSCSEDVYASSNQNVCTVCGNEYLPIKSEFVKDMYVVKDGVKARKLFYSNDDYLAKTYQKGAKVHVVGKVTNSVGSIWYELDNKTYIFIDNLSEKKVEATTSTPTNSPTAVPDDSGYSDNEEGIIGEDTSGYEDEEFDDDSEDYDSEDEEHDGEDYDSEDEDYVYEYDQDSTDEDNVSSDGTEDTNSWQENENSGTEYSGQDWVYEWYGEP